MLATFDQSGRPSGPSVKRQQADRVVALPARRRARPAPRRNPTTSPLPEGDAPRRSTTGHLPAQSRSYNQLPTQLAPAAPSISGAPNWQGAPSGARPRRSCPPRSPAPRRPRSGPKPGTRAGSGSRPDGPAVVEDLGDLRAGGDEEALCLASEGVTQTPGVHLDLESSARRPPRCAASGLDSSSGRSRRRCAARR